RLTKAIHPGTAAVHQVINMGVYGNYVVDIPAYMSYDTYAYDQAGNRISHTKGTTNSTTTYTEKMYFDSLGRMRTYQSFTGLSTSYAYTYDANTKGVGGLAVGGYQRITTQSDGHAVTDKIEYFGRTSWHRDFGNHDYTYTYNQAGWLVRQTSTAGQHLSFDYYANGYLKSL